MVEEVSPPRYSRRAMARVALSMEARALSDSAHGMVSTWSDDYTHLGASLGRPPMSALAVRRSPDVQPWPHPSQTTWAAS